MKPCTLIVPLLSALGVVCVNVHPVRGENSLAVAIAELDQLRYGGSPDFGEVERRGRELLGKYSQPEEQAQIYYALSHLYIQSSTKHYDLVIDYATRGLRLPLPDEQRLRLFVYLGDALRSENFGKKPFPEIRKMAVVPYLEGLKEAQRLRAPAERPEMPVAVFLDFSGDKQSPLYKRLRKKSDDSLEAQKRALEGDTLWNHRRVITGQIVDIYARKPYAAAELRQLATAILADPAAVDDLMKRVDEKVKERLKPAQANSGSSKATPPGGHNWSLPIITINLSAIGLLGSILWLRRRRRARDNNIAIS